MEMVGVGIIPLQHVSKRVRHKWMARAYIRLADRHHPDELCTESLGRPFLTGRPKKTNQSLSNLYLAARKILSPMASIFWNDSASRRF